MKQKASFLLLAAVAFSLAAKAQNKGQQATPAQMVDALHQAFGKHHARAVHTKGIILEGEFIPDQQAATITKAYHLQKENSQVILRFSDFAGVPDIPDNSGLANPRGFAIKFKMKDGRTTDIVGHSFNGFPTPNSDQFRDLLLAVAASGKEKTKPNTLDKYLDSHPAAKTFLTTQKIPASFASVTYFGVNAFKFTNAKGESVFTRYQFVPEAGEKTLSKAAYDKAGPTYMLDDIKKRVTNKPVVFKMYAQVAEKGDVIDDPSVAWPASRKLILLGTIKITKLSSNTVQEDKGLFFIPNNVPEGITPADPMIDIRSRAYPISVGERQ